MSDEYTDLPIFTLKFFIEDDILYGRVTRVHRQNGYEADSVCDKCTANKKNKPFDGMVVMWRLKQDGSDKLFWDVGKIVDPTSGKIYAATLTFDPSYHTASLRAYTGLSMFGRTVLLTRQR